MWCYFVSQGLGECVCVCVCVRGQCRQHHTPDPPPPPPPQLGSIYFEQLSCGIMFLLEMKNANMLIGSDLEVQWARGNVCRSHCMLERTCVCGTVIDTNLWTRPKWRDVRNIVPYYFKGNRRDFMFNEAGGKPNSGCVAFFQRFSCGGIPVCVVWILRLRKCLVFSPRQNLGLCSYVDIFDSDIRGGVKWKP